MNDLRGVAIVVLAGGVGARVGAGVNKTLLAVGGVPVVARSVQTALATQPSRVVVIVRGEDREELSQAIQPVLEESEVWLVDGGVERHDSEWNALRALAPSIESGEIDIVAIHDGARPLATADLYRAVVRAAREVGGAIPVVKVDHLLGVAEQPDLVAVQTPQAFHASVLLDAYRRADAEGFRGTDTAACIERFTDLRIVGVPSTPENLKVTYPQDLAVAERLLPDQ